MKAGTNGFTSIPTVLNLAEPDPMCMDAAAKQWWDDLMNNAPKPSNTVPGITYMGRGGAHWEKDKKVHHQGRARGQDRKRTAVLDDLWPFDPKATMLPTKPNPSGVYLMFDESPYAHDVVSGSQGDEIAADRYSGILLIGPL